VQAIAWALNEQVRIGELTEPHIDGGHRDVYATICPTDKVMAQIPLINATNPEEGTVTARSFNGWLVLDEYPTATFTAPGGKQVYCNSREVAVVLEYWARRWHAE